MIDFLDMNSAVLIEDLANPAIANPPALSGCQIAHHAMSDLLIIGYLERLQIGEVIPTVPAVPVVEFRSYLATVRTRFVNARVPDIIAGGDVFIASFDRALRLAWDKGTGTALGNCISDAL